MGLKIISYKCEGNQLSKDVTAIGISNDLFVKLDVSTASKLMTRYYNFQEGIDRANQKALSNAQKVQKWIILGQDFSVPGGELGPTMKMKRHVVLQKYGDNVEKFYV